MKLPFRTLLCPLPFPLLEWMVIARSFVVNCLSRHPHPQDQRRVDRDELALDVADDELALDGADDELALDVADLRLLVCDISLNLPDGAEDVLMPGPIWLCTSLQHQTKTCMIGDVTPDGQLVSCRSQWNDDIELFVYSSRVPEMGARLELELFCDTTDDGRSTLARGTVEPSKWFPQLLASEAEPWRLADDVLRRPSTITVELSSTAIQGDPRRSLHLTLILATSPRGPYADVIGSYRRICQAQAARAACEPRLVRHFCPRAV
ncbi:hypothetical protein CALVIDRAFT_543460 [Calocera viscosa TUFC12733]|uniref:C2 domain-containing protein n=1 Tax=Calocera viscosa (strain TUFC12733) TaxID=1330018 RepID=A0A167FK54_CALVF|nr:hypothetical protein CALVIDRAFT_543460 [Calocera viscosa TUFC12733]